MRPTKKSAIQLSLLVLGISFSLHLLNLFINNVLHIEANYFFTMKDLASQMNPAFALFASWIPIDYLYLIVALPILYLYMAIVYLLMSKSPKSH